MDKSRKFIIIILVIAIIIGAIGLYAKIQENKAKEREKAEAEQALGEMFSEMMENAAEHSKGWEEQREIEERLDDTIVLNNVVGIENIVKQYMD